MTQERPHEGAPPGTDGPMPDVPDRPAPAQRVQAAQQTLRQAMRRARHDDAERMGAIISLRAASVARLELLEDALDPLRAQIPKSVDLFDFAVLPGANPRLFIDMIGFVEMARDGRTYRLVQDTRHGRTLLAESADVARLVDAITDYVARRLLERDKALAADGLHVDTPPRSRRRRRRLQAAAPRPSQERLSLVDVLGFIAFVSIVLAILAFVALQFWPNLSDAWPGLLGSR